MDIHEIKDIMNQNADRICIELLPGGKKQGKEWCTGNFHDEKGESLKIVLTGKNRGAWCDFSTGEKGDLIGLWKNVRSLDLVAALKEIKDFLKITEPAFDDYKKNKTYAIPVPHKREKSTQVVSYLTKVRKLSLEALRTYELESNGDFYYLPSKRNGIVIAWKEISIYPDSKGKKVMRTSVNTEHCLFGWQAIDPNATEIYITEGELDAISMWQYGAPAVSIPFGAGSGSKHKWIDNEFTHLERFETIYLCFDDDEAGQANIREIAQRLGMHRCKSVILPKKDANECLVAGISAVELSAQLKITEFQPDKLINVNTYREEVRNSFFSPGSTTQGVPFRLVPDSLFKFRDGEITLWTGINGEGKSMILGQVVLDLIRAGEKSCIASMEMKPDKLIKRMIRQAGLTREPSHQMIDGIFDWLEDSLWLVGQQGRIDILELMNTFVYARKRYGVKHFVIDSLMKCGIDGDDYNRQKRFVESLCDFIVQYNCHIHLVAHPRKTKSEHEKPNKMDVSGSADIVNMVDNVIVVTKDALKQEAMNFPNPDDSWLNKPDGHLYVKKQRNGEYDNAKLPLWYHRESFQFMRSKQDQPLRYVDV